MRTLSRKSRVLPHATLLIIVGIILVGWFLPAPDAAQTHQSGESEAAMTSSMFMPPKSPSLKRDLVSLANPEVAHRLKLSPEQYRRIARIDEDLDREARRTMQAAIERWQQTGGFHVGPIPNFRDPSSHYGQRLKALKQAAEEKISSVLSSAELSQWQEEARPMSGMAAERFVSATL